MKVELKIWRHSHHDQQVKKHIFQLKPIYCQKEKNEEVIVDFEGVLFFPSWADEFLTKLTEEYPDKISYIHTENPSVQATLETLKRFQNMKTRTSRWGLRAEVKTRANKRKNSKFLHPQVRRQLDKDH